MKGRVVHTRCSLEKDRSFRRYIACAKTHAAGLLSLSLGSDLCPECADWPLSRALQLG